MSCWLTRIGRVNGAAYTKEKPDNALGTEYSLDSCIYDVHFVNHIYGLCKYSSQ